MTEHPHRCSTIVPTDLIPSQHFSYRRTARRETIDGDTDHTETGNNDSTPHKLGEDSMSEVVSDPTENGAGPDLEEAPDIDSTTTPEQSTEQEESTLPLDQVFGILKNQRRRRVLKYLQDADGKVSLSELAEQIAAWENEKDVGQISSGERKRVYVGLYQCHLPKMDSMGVVAFNKPRGVIEPGENTDILYKYLERADEESDPPWHTYSATVSLAGATTLAAALLAQPMTAAPILDVVVGAVVVGYLLYALTTLNWKRTVESDDDSAT